MSSADAASRRAEAGALRFIDEERSVLLVAAAGEALWRSARRAAERTGFEVEGVDALSRLQARLLDEAAPLPRCVLLGAEPQQAASLVTWMRGHPRLLGVPVLLGVPRPSESVFLDAHATGIDDVVLAFDDGGLTRRLARLASLDPLHRPEPTLGRLLVVHPDAQRRSVLGRVLRLAGFEVAFAERLEEAAEHAPARTASSGVAWDAVVAAAGTLGALGERRLQGSDPLGVLPPGPGGAPLARALVILDDGALGPLPRRGTAGRIGVVADAGPAHDLLFVVNETLRSELQEQRASPRLLHGTLCAFREAGALHASYGLTYNVSAGGLFVRTLDSPQHERVWLELRPPGERAAVHLRGVQVWRREPGGQGASPPGFGVRLLRQASPPEDWRRYQEAYERLRRERLGQAD